MKKTTDQFLNILYPRSCPICHRILKDQKSLICRECAVDLKPYSGPRCMKCGRPVKAEQEYCSECAGISRSFTQGRGIYLYDDRMRASLVKYKYYGRREYGDFYAAAMCRYAEKELRLWKPDLILPVPLHPAKQRQRGFNQAEYLADRIGDHFGIPVTAGILKKIRRTRSQKKLDAAERRRNLQGAFGTEDDLEGLDILIIDDVYTTGSTVDAASAALLEAGAERTFFLAICMAEM